ncbi:MAG: hypothetical protein ACFFDQ_02440 [Candidatus Thorarchaeota archaeon]
MLAVVVISLIAMNLGSVEAATSQGFEWGIDVGDRIDYQISYSQPTIVTDPAGTYVFYVNVTTLPTIPDPATLHWDISIGGSSVQFFYTNGTELFNMAWGAYAIGNWSLASELYETTHTDDMTSETTTDWTTSRSIPYGGDQTMTTEMRFSKTDGAMNYYNSTITNNADGLVASFVRITRSGYNPGTDSTTVTTSTSTTTSTTGTNVGTIDPTLLITLGAGGAVLIIVILFLKKRS